MGGGFFIVLILVVEYIDDFSNFKSRYYSKQIKIDAVELEVLFVVF